MATSTASRPLTSDPLRSFKFNVNIPINVNTPNGLSMARLGFMTAAGLGVAIEPLTYREGGDNLTTRKMPGQADINPITLSRGLFPTDQDGYNWMSNLFMAVYGGGSGIPSATSTLGGSPDFRTIMYLNVLQHPNNTPNAIANTSPYQSSYPNQNNIVQVSFKLFSAWIGSLAYSDFDAGGNAVAVEQMTINYEGFEVVYGGNGFVTNPTSW